MIMNGHTNKLFKNIFNDFLAEGKKEINMVYCESTVSLSLSGWYPGSGVVLDCIDS